LHIFFVLFVISELGGKIKQSLLEKEMKSENNFLHSDSLGKCQLRLMLPAAACEVYIS